MPPQTLQLPTAGGSLPVRRFTPPGTPKGGLIFYMDAFGWRDELDAMCARYAQAGYTTYLPDLYWRLGSVRFPVPANARIPLDPAMARANTATTVEMSIADTAAILAHAAPGLTRFGTVGYCMGARHALGAAAAHGETIRAAACLHGGRMVWDGANSPHLYIPCLRGAVYFGFAADDETCPPAHQALIEQTLRNSGTRGEAEHYAAAHGWTFPTRWCHDPAAAEHAFARVLALLDREVAT